jgi:UDP-glucuronate decarboxylase
MRYLVTGGLGFLGTNLCKRLLADGHEVVALDNMATAAKANAAALGKNKKFSFVRHDIVNPLPDIGKFDFIYNLACPASPPHYQRDPIQTFRTSVWGIWNVLEYAHPMGTAIFHSSTSEVYGDPLVHPQNEHYWGNVNPCGVRACYDEGKRAAEALLFDYNRKHGHPIKVVRIFNTYGPHMDPNDGRVVSNFAMQALRGEPLTVYGTGKQTRSFCFVDDMMDGFLKMEKSRADFLGPLNLGNPKEFTLLELAGVLGKVMGKRLKLEFLNLPKDDPRQRRPDIALAKSELGWEPKVGLEEGLGKTVKYFRGAPD